MAWGKRKPPADTPRWNQDDYHREFAVTLKEQITQGVAPWQKPWEARREPTPQKHPDRQAVPGREFGLP